MNPETDSSTTEPLSPATNQPAPSNQQFGFLLAALASGALVIPTAFLTFKLNLFGCEQGFDSIGCIILGGIAAVAISIAIAGAAGYLILKHFGIRRAAGVSILASITVMMSWWIIRVAPGLFLEAFAIMILYFLAYSFYALLLNRRNLSTLYIIVVVVITNILVFYTSSWLAQMIDSQPSTHSDTPYSSDTN